MSVLSLSISSSAQAEPKITLPRATLLRSTRATVVALFAATMFVVPACGDDDDSSDDDDNDDDGATDDTSTTDDTGLDTAGSIGDDDDAATGDDTGGATGNDTADDDDTGDTTGFVVFDDDDDDDAAGDDDDDSIGGGDAVTPIAPNACAAPHFKTVNVTVGGTQRSYLISTPEGVDDEGPWPLVFSWHGYGDDAQNFHSFACQWANNDTMPFIAVSPVSLALQPFGSPQGIEWDFTKPRDGSVDLAFFDAILADVKATYDIDETRIHSMGFSAGAIFTDLLGYARGDIFASIISFSGIYFSNSANNYPIISWAGAENSDRNYVQLMTHGGSADTLNFGINVTFGTDTVEDATYLNDKGHDTIICDHNSGHTIPFGLYDKGQPIRFFADHPFGVTKSPYASALPATFPNYCTFSAAK